MRFMGKGDQAAKDSARELLNQVMALWEQMGTGPARRDGGVLVKESLMNSVVAVGNVTRISWLLAPCDKIVVKKVVKAEEVLRKRRAGYDILYPAHVLALAEVPQFE